MIPFSRSRSPESITRSATPSAWCSVNAPPWRSIASTRVVLPWSTWATIATLRRSLRETDMAEQGSLSRGDEGPEGPFRVYGAWRCAPHRRRSSRSPPRLAAWSRSRRTSGWTAPGCSTSPATRHRLTLVTTRRDGRPQVSPVTGGVDADGPDRHLDVPRPREGGEPAPRPGRLRARALRRVGRPVGAGRRHRRGARHAVAGGRGRAGRVLPLHLRRAPRLGRVPRRRCAARASR